MPKFFIKTDEMKNKTIKLSSIFYVWKIKALGNDTLSYVCPPKIIICRSNSVIPNAIRPGDEKDVIARHIFLF